MKQSTFRSKLTQNPKIGKSLKLPKILYPRSEKDIKSQMEVPNLNNKLGLKIFTKEWYVGVSKAIQAVVDEQNKSILNPKPGDKPIKVRKPAKFVSRSDLSRTRPDEEIEDILNDKTLCLGNKGFFGTPLCLISDIRKSEVIEGKVGQLLEAFGVAKRFNRVVTLHQGPNRRLNRYLVFQYKRLIKSIDGTLVKGDKLTPAHIIWKYDFYRLSALDSGISSKERKILRSKARKYWGIGNQLLLKSNAFRMALFTKSLGKVGRWFHRNFDIVDLFNIYKEYQEIADRFSSKVKVKRVWICTEQRDKSWKWRPLGTSPFPWRIFTRGVNNLLEAFISASWPDNQHGYKSGRGVHTVWNHVLTSVVKAKYIFEFDFTGFFNTVRLEAVGDTLHRFYVPKFMIAYLVAISSVDVENITKDSLLKNLKTKNPRKQGWEKAWNKYEYIHKYRKGYRSTGLPQGFALSPLLSVITLIALDELENQGIKYVIYCDDGIFYSDKSYDFINEAQDVLDKYGIGASFNMYKSRSIKEDGIWLNKLKLVGLEYDPDSDVLSASTRNGATLKLKIGAISVFSDTELPPIFDRFLRKWSERDHLDWVITNDKLFEYYERIYVLQGYQEHVKNKLFEDLATFTTKIIKKRLERYSLNDIYTLEYDEFEITNAHYELICTYAMLRILNRERFRNLVEVYEKIYDEPFPYGILEEFERNVWTLRDMSSKDFDKIYNERKLYWDKVQNYETARNLDEKSSELVLEQLRWFEQLDSPPENMIPMLKDREIELGEWLELTLEDLEKQKLPVDIANHIKEYGGKVAYTEVSWRNLYKDPVFATFIARLFQDTFRSNVKQQNFKLTKDRSQLTLVGLIDKHVGRNTFKEGFNIFNASSYAANMLVNLFESWHPHVKSKKVLSPVEAAYAVIKNKIANRRSDVDKFGSYMNNSYHTTYWCFKTKKLIHKKKGFRTEHGKWRKVDKLTAAILRKYRLDPQELCITPKHRITEKHLHSKYKNVKSLSIKAITRSTISTHELRTELCSSVRTEKIYPYKAVHWDTLAPLKEVPRPILKKNRSVIKIKDNSKNNKTWIPLSEHMKQMKDKI